MNNVLLAWQFLRRYPVIPIVILILLLVSAAIGPYITPYERDIGNIADRHLTLFSTSENTTVQVSKDDVVNGFHLLGTDRAGTRYFSTIPSRFQNIFNGGNNFNNNWNGFWVNVCNGVWLLWRHYR